MLKITKRSPFQFFFEIVRLSLVQFCFLPKGPPSIFLMICDRRDEKCQSVPLAPQSGPTFGFLGCFRREYFDTLKLYFSALDMAPTWAVPGLFIQAINAFGHSFANVERKAHGWLICKIQPEPHVR